MVDLLTKARPFRTVRARSAILSALVVAVSMTIGATVLVAAFRDQLESNLDQTLRQQAVDRALLLDQGSPAGALTTTLESESMLWIGLPSGEPIEVGGRLLPRENPLRAAIGTAFTSDLLVEETHRGESVAELERSRLRIVSAETADGSMVVLVGADTEALDDTVGRLARLFMAGVPALVLVVGVTAWFVTGRALRPVDRIRAQAASVSGSTLSERVPVPDSHDEIQTLAMTMNEMLDRIDSHERALRQFTADASHELKSPVANLRALADTATLSDPRWPPLQRRFADETDRLRELVSNLLFLASHDEQFSPDAGLGSGSSVHLDDLLFDEAELLAATAQVAVDIGGVGPATIIGDETSLARLVRNLVDNAARHASTTVFLASRTVGETVTLRIGDDGPGIPEEDRVRIFERFSRLDPARVRGEGGSGLGLAIVSQIAEAHLGSVAVRDARGGGAEFVVEFRAPSG